MAGVIGVGRNALFIDNPPDKETIADVIRALIGYAKTDLSFDYLAQILLAMLDLIDASSGSGGGGSTTTTVAVGYSGYVLTVTVNGISASANINPVTGGVVYEYDAGNGVYVRASSTGITAIKAAGTYTVTIPNGTTFLSCRIHGSSADVDPSNNVNIVFANMANVTTADNIYPPIVTLYDRILGVAPTSDIPWVYNISNSPQAQIIALGLNTVTFRFLNMNAYLNWGLKLDF